MAEEYFQLNHTGQQIDDAVNEINNLKSRVETNTANIQTNTTDIDTLERNIDSKNAQINTNTDNIKDCFKRINTIESATINNLQTQINDHNTDISGLRTSLNNKVEAKDYKTAIDNLKAKDDQLQRNIDRVAQDQTTQLGLVKDRVRSNEENIVALSGRIDNMNESVGNIEGLTQSISSLSQTYNEFIAGDFANTKKTANDALAAVGQLQATHQTDIEGIQAILSKIPNTYETQENFTSFVTNTFNPLSEEIYGESGINSQITNFQTQISGLQKQIDNLQKQINELKGSTT